MTKITDATARLREAVEVSDADRADEFADAEFTGERPDLHDAEIEVYTDDVRLLLAALSPAPQAMAGEAESIVKPLVWKNTGAQDGLGGIHVAAETIFGRVTVYGPEVGGGRFHSMEFDIHARSLAGAQEAVWQKHEAKVLDLLDLTGWLSPSHAREQAERVVDLEAALTRIDEWARAYPEEAFPEPDLAICKTALEGAGQSIDGLHASWARHILNGIGGITRTVLAEGGRGNG